jgi:ribosomal protein L10
MDKEILSVEKIEILSKLPSLDEARAQLIGLIKYTSAKNSRITCCSCWKSSKSI